MCVALAVAPSAALSAAPGTISTFAGDPLVGGATAGAPASPSSGGGSPLSGGGRPASGGKFGVLGRGSVLASGSGDGGVRGLSVAHGRVRFAVPSRTLKVSRRGLLVLRLSVSRAASASVRLGYWTRLHGEQIAGLLAVGRFSTSHAGAVTLDLGLNGRGDALLQRAGRLHSVLTLISGPHAGRFSLELESAASR